MRRLLRWWAAAVAQPPDVAGAATLDRNNPQTEERLFP
jgi:hypothetical protein